MIKQEASGENDLPEYVIDDLLLYADGVDENKEVARCHRCLHHLKNGKLPPLSVANNFQIGKTPPELQNLTLPEKLLISIYRPKIYITTLRSVAGPGTSQRALKGNTISFPQDIVKISDSLPSDPRILVDTIKVVFIGSGVPSKEMLKKVFTVRREVVYNALTFLVQNHPLYTNIRISQSVNLPDDDIPDEIWRTMAVHEGADENKKEHANYTPQTYGSNY